MKTKLISITLLVAVLVAAFGFAPMTSVNAAPLAQIAIPITGTFTDAVGGTGTFVGNLDIQRFGVRNGVLTAFGTLTGTLTDSLGNVVGTVTRNIQLPITNIQATCEILHLELGPLDLTLLGLRVELNRIVLDITAEPGGGLLGDLLCAVANLLSGGNLNAIARLLNQILNILG